MDDLKARLRKQEVLREYPTKTLIIDGKPTACGGGQLVHFRNPDGEEAVGMIEHLEAQLAEARGEPDRIVEFVRAEAQTCDCFAREEGECACGAWDSEPGERSNKRAYVEDIADAIEKRNNGQ